MDALQLNYSLLFSDASRLVLGTEDGLVVLDLHKDSKHEIFILNTLRSNLFQHCNVQVIIVGFLFFIFLFLFF